MYTFFGTKMTNSHFLLWIWYNGCSFLIKQAVSEFWQVVRKKTTIIRYYRKGKILASHIVNSLVLEAFRRGIITLCAACTLESIGTLANTVKCWFFQFYEILIAISCIPNKLAIRFQVLLVLWFNVFPE